MSLADELFIENCRDIIANGVSDEECHVRPHWEDGTPAHTIKKFCIVNRYDLQKEFPIMTLRRVYYRSAIDEILWIYQKKSNRVADLSSHIWDAWADESGSIGKAYGYQLSIKHQYPEGEMDQVDRVLYDLKHNPASRRILTSLYNHQDLQYLQSRRPQRNAAGSLRLFHDVQRHREQAQRDTQPAQPGHAHREQLERLPVCGAAHNVREIHRIRAG